MLTVSPASSVPNVSIIGELHKPGVYTVTGHDLISTAISQTSPTRCLFNLIPPETLRCYQALRLATGCSAACLQKLTRITENINAVSLKSSGREVCLSGKVCWFSVLFVCRLVRCTHRDMPLFRFLSEHSQMHWALEGSTHLAAQFLHVPVPFRPDSKALNISGVLRRVCNMVIPVSALAFPVSAPTVKLWFDRAGAKC